MRYAGKAILSLFVPAVCGALATSVAWAQPAPHPMVRACGGGQLVTWAALPGGGAAGSIYYTVEISNTGRRACMLSAGYPAVRALRWNGHQIGDRSLGDGEPSSNVILQARHTAHFTLQDVDALNYTRRSCHPTTSAAMSVALYGLRGRTTIPVRLSACAKRGHVFLATSPIRPGVGIPGQP